MSDREDRLRSLLDKVRAKRPEERITRAGDAVERIRDGVRHHRGRRGRAELASRARRR